VEIPIRVLSTTDRCFIDRFSAGYTPALAKQVRAAGGGRKWFERQLKPTKVKDRAGKAVDSWFPTLWFTPAQLFQRHQDDITPSWELMADFGRWTMMRRALSNRQLLEVMTDFWSNLLHIPVGDDEAWPYRIAYDKVIRANALGTFSTLLQQTITHPSMGLFLDNASSTKDAPNENLGRELLELHSVGLGAGYTEDDVLNSSRLLTGYRVDLWWPKFQTFYDTSWHWTGQINVLGFSHPNTSADGRTATNAYLKYLAHHPATAQRIAKRLCVKFVRDNPSSELVNAVATAFTKSGTSIKATLRAMVSHPEFISSRGSKVRSPIEDTVATTRALRVAPTAPTSDQSFARAIYWAATDQGQTPYSWPAPNGFPEVNGAWSTPGRVLNTFDFHRTLGAFWWPTKQASIPSDATWLPAFPATYSAVIDAASLALLGTPIPQEHKDGIAQRSGISLTTSLNSMSHDRVVQLIVALLDSPTHMMR